MLPDTTVVYPEIAKRIRMVREMRCMTQAVLAKRLGITRVSVANIEAGRQQTPIHRLYAIALVLNCDIDVLIPTLPEVQLGVIE